VQKFVFGSRIFCSNSEDGVLTHVGFDPTTRHASQIGVKQGRLFGKTVYLPFNTVTDASGEGVNLNITREELASASRKELAGVLLDHRSIVCRVEAVACGTLMLVMVQPESGELAYIVVRSFPAGQDTLLCQEHVKKLDNGRIELSIPDATLHTLPPYRSDAELQQEVEEILCDLIPLHVDFKGMTVHVLESVLYLDGNISSSLRGDIVRDQALGIIGLLEIKNRLVGDDRLASDLAMALAQDPRTRALPIGVYPRSGVVRLSGAVHNEEQKVAAAEIACSIPGVRSVVNDLVIDPRADMLYVMSSVEGSEAIDQVPGQYIRHTK
jgi:osmotically-inducible protein OsmY